MSVLLTLIKNQVECVYHVSSYVCGHFVCTHMYNKHMDTPSDATLQK